MAVVLALGSALTYGVADFLGGRVAARAPALTVTVGSQAVGLAVLLVAVAVLPGEATGAALGLGALAGLAGGGGLVLYFRALAIGPMGVVAPITGAVGAAVPILVGAATGERVGPLAVVGIVLGLAAVVLSSVDPNVGPPVGMVARVRAMAARADRASLRGSGPLLGVAAGVAFGAFFVLLDLAPSTSGAWPLVGARLASVPALGLVALVRRSAAPARADWGQTAASGALDVVANALFLLAARAGLLVVVGLVVSLYPVVIVLLARQVLGERLEPVQLVGVGLALSAVVLVGIGG